MRAIIQKQLINVAILKAKSGFFGKKYLVVYNIDWREHGVLMYTSSRTKWIPERNLIPSTPTSEINKKQ